MYIPSTLAASTDAPLTAYTYHHHSPSDSITTAQTNSDTFESALENNPHFQIIAALLHAGQNLKDQSIELLKSRSGELDAKTMAYFNEYNEQANQLMTIATNMQKSDQDVRASFIRNMV